ncbi:MAG: hypothetical protein K9N48_03520 [Verrucomicrobia bacterium]|nr:hypothetical protein [Verrucomicrobiota bacterium]MCF7708147.1 hypothetical protein [Verrucomicrobiota bacterium]
MENTTNQGRGVLILVLGILSIVLCAPLGPFAWIMGSGDLKKIGEGQISQDAKGLTQAGMICGIIGTVFLVIGVLWIVLFGGIAILGGMR